MTNATTITVSNPFTAPYRDTCSIRNAHLVLQAVAERFPDFAPQCEPYVNVLTLREWNRRGYRVKKGERAIRVGTMIPVWKDDAGTDKKVQVGHRWHRAYVFALPQVEKKH